MSALTAAGQSAVSSTGHGMGKINPVMSGVFVSGGASRSLVLSPGSAALQSTSGKSVTAPYVASSGSLYTMGAAPFGSPSRVVGERRMSSGIIERVMEDASGRRFKDYSCGSRSSAALRTVGSLGYAGAWDSRNAPRAMAEATGISESFEGYNGFAADWIPADWEERNAEGNTPASTTANYTWHVTGADGAYKPTNGKYQAFVQYASVAAGNVPNPQDEWLISPSFVPQDASRLYADITLSLFSIYDPEYFDPSTLTFSKRRVTATLKVMVEADGFWQEIFNARDLASRLGDAELYNSHRTPLCHTLRLPLARFAGKSIRVAFVYAGDNGNSVALDYVAVGTPNMLAVYHRPAGYMFQGMSEDFSYQEDFSVLFGPAYTPSQWRALYTRDVESVEWTFTNPDNLDTEITTTEMNPVMTYPYSISWAPKITAKGQGMKDMTYYFDVPNEKDGLLRCGGGTEDFNDGIKVYGAGSYNFNSGIQSPVYSYDAGSFIFGPGANENFWKYYNRRLVSVASFYEKPLSTYWFDRIWIALRDFNADADAVFTLNIYDASNGIDPTHPMASATCRASEVQAYSLGDGTYLYNVPFSFEKDAQGNDAWVEIDRPIMVELTGFMDNPKVRAFAPMTQNTPHVDAENNGYVFYYEDINGKNEYSLASTSYLLNNFYCPFIFTMNATYSFLFTDDNTFDAPAEGGSKALRIKSCYYPEAWDIEGDLPEWVNMFETDSEFDDDGTIGLNIGVDPLPDGVPGRACTITLRVRGARQEIVIKQGNTTGVQSATAGSGVQIERNGNSWMITCPATETGVSLYDMAGRELRHEALSPSGRHAMNIAGIADGCYLLRFTSGKTVKIKK